MNEIGHDFFNPCMQLKLDFFLFLHLYKNSFKCSEMIMHKPLFCKKKKKRSSTGTLNSTFFFITNLLFYEGAGCLWPFLDFNNLLEMKNFI